MKKYADGLALLASCAWIGSMWAIGFIAAPVLFQALPDKAVAGMLAGRMFEVTGYAGLACATFLLAYLLAEYGRQCVRQPLFWIVGLMLLFVMAGQFGLQPLLSGLKAQAMPLYVMDSSYADQFRFWHGVSSLIFLAQSILGGVMLLKMRSKTR